MTPDKIKVSAPQETLTINLPKDVTLESFLKKVDDIVEKDYAELHEKAYVDYKDKNPGKSFDDFMNDHLSDLYAKLNVEYGIGVLEQKANISEELKKLNFEVKETVATPANTSVEQDDRTNSEKSIHEMKKEFDKIVYDRKEKLDSGLGIKFDPNRNLSDPVDATTGLKAKNYTNLFDTKLNVSTTDVAKDTKTEDKAPEKTETVDAKTPEVKKQVELTPAAQKLKNTYGADSSYTNDVYNAWAESMATTKISKSNTNPEFAVGDVSYVRRLKDHPVPKNHREQLQILKDIVPNTTGTYKNLDQIVTGSFDAKGLLQGQGKVINGDCDFMEGNFKDNSLNGQGKYNRSDGRVYEGNFKDDQFNGQGKLTLANGKVVEGNRVDDKLDGKTVSGYVEEYGNTVPVTPVNNVNTVSTNATSDIAPNAAMPVIPGNPLLYSNPSSGFQTSPANVAPEFKVDPVAQQVRDLYKQKQELMAQRDALPQGDSKRVGLDNTIQTIEQSVRDLQNPSQAKVAPSTNKDAKISSIENATTGYASERLYAQTELSDKERHSPAAQRKLLRQWIRADDDALLDISAKNDRIGDQIVDKDTKADKNLLKASLKRPLKMLVINRGTLNLKMEDVRSSLEKAYNNKDKSAVDKSYREANKPSDLKRTSIFRKGADKLYTENMTKLYNLYASSRDGSLGNSYANDIVQMMTDSYRSGEMSGDHDLIDIHNANNNDAGQVELTGGYQLLDDPIADAEAARDYLTQLTGSDKQADILIDNGKKHNMFAVEVYNAKVLMDKGDSANTKPDTDRFVHLLGDYSLDGRVNRSDTDVNSGQELKFNYDLAKKTLQAEGITNVDKVIGDNIRTYMKDISTKNGKIDIAKALDTTTDFKTLVSQNPYLVKEMQQIFANLPQGVDLHSILSGESLVSQEKNTSQKNTIEEYKATLSEADKKILDAKITEGAEKAYMDIQSQRQQLNLEGDDKYFDFVDKENLKLAVANNLLPVLKANQAGLSAGFAVGLDKIMKGLQANVSVAMGPNGIPVPGIGLGWNGDLGKGWATGTNVNFLVPGIDAYINKSRTGNKDKLAQTLNGKGIVTNSVGANISVSVIGSGAGISFSKDRDKLAGIREQYNGMIHTMESFATEMVALGTDRTKISNALLAKYPKSSKEEIQAATQDVLDALSYADSHMSAGASKATLLSDYFCTQWKEREVGKVNGTKLTGISVGANVFMLGNAIPLIIPVGLRFKNYYKGYTHNETQASIANRRREEYNGINNRELNLTTTDAKVKYMNDLMLSSGKHAPIESIDGGKFIRVPASLYAHNKLNIKLSQSLKGRVAQEKGDLIIPSDANLRMAVATGATGASYVLNVGSVVSSPDDLYFVQGREGLLNTPGFFVAKDKITSTTEPIALEQIKSTFGDKFKDAGVSIDAFADNKLTYTVAGKQNIVDLTAGSGEIVGADDKKIALTWDQVKQSLKLSMEGKKVDVAGKTENIDFALAKAQLQEAVRTELSDSKNLKFLEDLEEKSGFYTFLEHTMERDGAQAAVSLTSLIGDKLPNLKSALNSTDTTVRDTAISYMLSVFAIEDMSYKNKTIHQLMDIRKDAYTRLPSFAGTPMNFVDRSEYKDLVDANKKIDATHTNENMNNIIGYTAFYRKHKGTEHRGYALTAPGNTNVVGGKVESPKDTEKAKAWLLANIEKDSFASKTILDNINSKLGDVKLTNTKQLFTLLKDGKVTLDNGCTISIDASPVIYLLGECANESIGLQINAITTTCKQVDGAIVTETVGGDMTQVAKSGRFLLNVARATGVADKAGQQAANIAFAIGGNIKNNGGGKTVEEDAPDIITDPIVEEDAPDIITDPNSGNTVNNNMNTRKD